MNISIKTRSIISLVIFIIFDHAIWYYCGIFDKVSSFYVFASEAVRIFALYGIVDYFSKKPHTSTFIFVIFIYCFIMFAFVLLAARSHYYADGSLLQNYFYIRKNAEVAIDSPFIAFFGYMLFVVSMYYFSWQYIDRPQSQKERMP